MIQVTKNQYLEMNLYLIDLDVECALEKIINNN